MNVTRWRGQSASIPDSTAHLLGWLNAVRTSGEERADEVAQILASAWHAWFDGGTACASIALWVRTTPQGVSLLGWAGEFEDEVEPPPLVPLPENSWPNAPIFSLATESVTREIIQKLGLLSGKISQPSLIVPFGETALALLWLQNEEGELEDEWRPLMDAASAHSGTTLNVALRMERLGDSLEQLGQAVGEAIDGREAHRAGFSRAVAYYSELIAREMRLDEGDVARIAFAAHWHGLGRLLIPNSILDKNTPLDAEELELVRSAPIRGADILGRVANFEPIAAIVRHQNERYDGTGSPDGLRGRAIPVGARILAVASRFAAMTHARADRGPLSVVGGAMDSVTEASGTALDPAVVNTFLKVMGRSAVSETDEP